MAGSATKRALARPPTRNPTWYAFGPNRDRVIREALEWLNQHGCIVQRTPPTKMIYLVRPIFPGSTQAKPKLIARRFATAGAPQITGMLPGGRFFAIYVRGKSPGLAKITMDWLRACARLGGAALVVSSMPELERAYEQVVEQNPDPWVRAADVEWVPPPLRAGRRARKPQRRRPNRGRWERRKRLSDTPKKASGPAPSLDEASPNASPLERRHGEG